MVTIAAAVTTIAEPMSVLDPPPPPRRELLTNLLLRKIFSKKSNFQIIELQDIEVSKKFHSKELEKIAVNA